MSKPQMLYEKDCRNCDRQIFVSLKVTPERVESKNAIRVRCAECKTTNYMEQTGSK